MSDVPEATGVDSRCPTLPEKNRHSKDRESPLSRTADEGDRTEERLEGGRTLRLHRGLHWKEQLSTELLLSSSRKFCKLQYHCPPKGGSKGEESQGPSAFLLGYLATSKIFSSAFHMLDPLTKGSERITHLAEGSSAGLYPST